MYFLVVARKRGEWGAVELDTGMGSAMDSSAWVKALPRAYAYLAGMLIPIVDLIAGRADR